MKTYTIRVTAFLLLLFLIFLPLYLPFANADTEKEKINSANMSVCQAFTNVLDAEKVGANVTDLLINLNQAGQLLSEAKISYQAGNYSEIETDVQNATIIVNQVNADAIELHNTGVTQSQNSFIATFCFSLVGTIVLVILLSLFWQRISRSQRSRLLNPEALRNGA